MKSTKKKLLAPLLQIIIFLVTACTSSNNGISTPQTNPELVFSSSDGRIVGDPIWSPTGKELSFTVFDPWVGDNEIYIVDIISENVRTLIDQDGVVTQSWSPDGKYIVYNLYREIWSIRTDKSMTPELLDSGQVAAYSPNGKQIAIFENIGIEQHNNYVLKTLDLQTGIEKTLLSINVGNQAIFDLSWSPDSTQLSFSLPSEIPDDTKNRHIYVFNIETAELSQFSLTGENYLPVWSPIGRQIAYIHRSSNSGTSSINISNTDGSCSVTVPSIHDVGGLAWSPNGSYLAYTQNADVYLLDLVVIYGEDFITTGPKCP